MTAYEYSGGPIRRDQALYVERSADRDFQRAIVAKRDVFIVTAPRQTGKTSFWFNALDHLRTNGFNTGLLDFRVVFGQPDEVTRSARGWTETLLRAVARSFKFDLSEVREWLGENPSRSTTDLIVGFFAEFVRKRVQGPMVVAFDEIDVVQLYHYFTDNFFEAIRALAAARNELDMSFVMIGLNHPKDLLKTAPTGGFNISGLHIALEDFDPEDPATVEAWANGYPAKSDLDRLAVAKAILRATGGQPFITSWLFEQARKSGVYDQDKVPRIIEMLIEDARNERVSRFIFTQRETLFSARPSLAFRIIDIIERLVTSRCQSRTCAARYARLWSALV